MRTNQKKKNETVILMVKFQVRGELRETGALEDPIPGRI